jgi:hypothetical protein
MNFLKRFLERIKYRRKVNKYFTYTDFGVKVDLAWYGESKELTERLRTAAYERAALIKRYGESEGRRLPLNFH